MSQNTGPPTSVSKEQLSKVFEMLDKKGEGKIHI